jgi:tetratricopeptide (TPR) repeat protein
MSLRKIITTRALVRPVFFPKTPTLTRPSIQLARYATQQRRRDQPSRPFRIPTLPVVLTSVGFICLGIGLYEYLTSDIQKFPVPVRQALRKALYYQNSNDTTLALKYFKEALSLALESPELEKNGAPLTGIMIQLGSLQESMGRLPEARQTLLLALRHLVQEHEKDPTTVELSAFTTLEQKKAVGIAQKLGDITASMKRDEEAEKWYVWSVEHLLKSSSKPKSEYGDTPELIFDEEHMPSWLTKTDVGAALEALGGFYASRNKPK